MGLETPIWYLLLVPWGLAVVYLLWFRRLPTAVPFLPLWQHHHTPLPASSERRRLPLWLWLILLAALAGIAAAGRPWFLRSHAGQEIIILLDRGVMSEPHYQPTLEHAEKLISEAAGSDGPVTLRVFPGDKTFSTDRSSWRAIAATQNHALTNPAAEMDACIARMDQSKPVFLISNRRIDDPTNQIRQIASPAPINNVGLVDLAIRQEALAECMVRIRNQSPLVDATLVMHIGEQTLRRPITLPPTGQTQSYFLPLPALSEVIAIEVQAPDDFQIDNRGYLLRRGAWPKIEVRGDVGAAMQRMVDVYSRNRPPGIGSRPLVVASSLFQLPTDQPAAAMARNSQSLRPLTRMPAVEFGDHSLLRHVDWALLSRDATAAASPGEGWSILIRSGDRVLLAYREEPVRQVWVGFQSRSFESSADFVVFWTNVFTWLGADAPVFAHEPMGALAPGGAAPQKPGVYQYPNGRRTAMNVVDVKFDSIAVPDHAKVEFALTPMRRNAAGILALASLLLLAAALWTRRNG